MLRTSLAARAAAAIAFNESHRRSGARLFEIGHVYPPGNGRAARRVRGAVRRARRRGGTGGDGGVARDLVGARRRRPRRSGPRAGRPARHTLGDAAGRQGPDRRGRRGRSGGARAVRRVRAGGDPRARPRPGARPRAQAGGVEAGQPLPVERPRPRVRACPTTCRPSDSRRRSGRVPARCSSTSSCSTCSASAGARRRASQPRLPAPAAGDRSQPHRRRHRRGRAARRGRSSAHEAAAPICEADADARRTRSREDAGLARRRSNARGCSRSSPATGRGCARRRTPTIQEDEGPTLVVSVADAVEVGAPVEFVAVWLTLTRVELARERRASPPRSRPRSPTPACRAT